MFNKNLDIMILLDFYSELLSERSKEALEGYYGDDLSLAELASGMGISRQGVRHLIKKGEEELKLFEEKLGLASSFTEMKAKAEELLVLSALLLKSEDENTRRLAQKAAELADIIRK